MCNKGYEHVHQAAESSEDELTGYSKVVVSQNLAEEILDEIYGKIDNKYENSAVNENGAIEAPLNQNEQPQPPTRLA